MKNGFKIGVKLRQLRMKKGYSQEFLADVLDVSQKTYSNMENDKTNISIDTLRKIATQYEIDMLELLQNGSIVQHNNSSETSTIQGIVYNHLSDALVKQKDDEIAYLKMILMEKDVLLKEKDALIKQLALKNL